MKANLEGEKRNPISLFFCDGLKSLNFFFYLAKQCISEKYDLIRLCDCEAGNKSDLNYVGLLPIHSLWEYSKRPHFMK